MVVGAKRQGDRLKDLGDVRVLLAFADVGAGRFIRGLVGAAGVRDCSAVRSVPDALVAIGAERPDLLISDLAIGDVPAPKLVGAIRKGKDSANPYLPIMIATSNREMKYFRASIAIGIHEYVLVPCGINAMAETIYRAVFMGRPFIDVPGYFGPCRRRRQAALPAQGDRRVQPWPGYTHSAQRAENTGAA